MEDLVESILDYVRADYTDYAIMINGENNIKQYICHYMEFLILKI